MSEQRFFLNAVVPTLFRRLHKQMFDIIIYKNDFGAVGLILENSYGIIKNGGRCYQHRPPKRNQPLCVGLTRYDI